MSYISVQEVSKTYQQKGTSFRAMDRVNLEIEKGEFICLLGPSGCGKTTLLNTMAGFEKADSGSILIDGQPVTKPVPNRVTVFQHYGLLPWQTVEKNVMFGLEAQKVPKEEARKWAESIHRDGWVAGLYPSPSVPVIRRYAAAGIHCKSLGGRSGGTVHG